jgi:hypothetical protein
MKVMKVGLCAVALLVAGLGSSRADAPLQLALWPPNLQLTAAENPVTGLRLEIYGRNAEMHGVDLGILHETTGNWGGLAMGLSSRADGYMHGVSLNYGYVRVSGEAVGWIHGKVGVVHGDFTGLRTGCIGWLDGEVHGVQLDAIYGRVGKHISGVQLGLINRSASVKGLQFGLVNLTDQMEGVQIGLWNQIDAKESWKVIPLVNAKF